MCLCVVSVGSKVMFVEFIIIVDRLGCTAYFFLTCFSFINLDPFALVFF